MNLEPAFRFLRALKRNNNREWFERHKGQYQIARHAFEEFLEALHEELVRFDESMVGLNPRKAAFRIYRDVRFSKDKRPYKTNMGAAFSAHGKMEQEPGYYIHVEPGNCFVAGGLYMPDAANLARVRQEIDYNGKALLDVLNQRSFKRFFGGLDDFDKLKTVPKGYPKDHPHIDLLRHKSFVASHMLNDNVLLQRTAVMRVAAVCRAVKPLNDFLKMALEE
ncbi:MAG: TIGR02453 family protein [Cyclobacteriaceae bacterium]|nr:MAG: TIGR02453 family protein [Cyclobacteriaceae bacterium]